MEDVSDTVSIRKRKKLVILDSDGMDKSEDIGIGAEGMNKREGID